MRSKRLLTMLLVLCMVVSAVSPAFAVEAPEDSMIGKLNRENSVAAKTESSPFENDRVVSADAAGTQNLRDDAGYIPNVEETELVDVDGKWVVSPAEGKLPDTSLMLTETPEALKELKEAAETYGENDMVTAFVVMEDKPLSEVYGSIGMVSAFDEAKLIDVQNMIIRMIEKFVPE